MGDRDSSGTNGDACMRMQCWCRCRACGSDPHKPPCSRVKKIQETTQQRRHELKEHMMDSAWLQEIAVTTDYEDTEDANSQVEKGRVVESGCCSGGVERLEPLRYPILRSWLWRASMNEQRNKRARRLGSFYFLPLASTTHGSILHEGFKGIDITL
jgi:hypothetical protein